MPSKEGSICLPHNSGTVGKSADKSVGGPPPGAQDPCFCSTSWSLAGSTSLQQGYGVRRASGGTVVVEVGVTVLGVGCGGQGGQQARVFQMRAGGPLLCQWVLFPGILRSKVFMSLALCLSGNRAPFSLLASPGGCGARSAYSPRGYNLSSQVSSWPHPRSFTHPVFCFLFPLSPSVQPGQPLPVSHLIRTQN